MQMLTSVVFTDKNHYTNEQIVFMFLRIYKYLHLCIYILYVCNDNCKRGHGFEREVWKAEREWVNDLVIISKKLNLFMILEMNALLGNSVWMEEGGCWEHWVCVFPCLLPVAFSFCFWPPSGKGRAHPHSSPIIVCVVTGR